MSQSAEDLQLLLECRQALWQLIQASQLLREETTSLCAENDRMRAELARARGGDETVKLRYLIFRHGEVWVAACMELCLATQDIGLRVAEAKLDEQVLSYIEDATTLDGGKHKQRLLNRPAPLTDRLSYCWCRFREAMGFPDSYARTKQKLYTGTKLIDITRAYLDPW